MSTDTTGAAQLAPYDDEEEILLMDTDGNTLQLDEPLIDADINEIEKPMKKVVKPPIVLGTEILRVYIRDGPNRHHVEKILVDDKYYELPTMEGLTSIGITEEQYQDILQSLNLTKEDFRSLENPSGMSRPESLYVYGVNKMNTQEILNCFEEFEPIGIEWVSDSSCNVFWHDTSNPMKVLSTKTHPSSSTTDQPAQSLKRKASSISRDDADSHPSGHWREGTFQCTDKPEAEMKLYLRYTTLEDRKIFGAEKKSEYYRQHGNPNYNNMTGLISRTKKRALRTVDPRRFRDFKVVKSNDPTTTSSSIEEETAAEDITADPNVKFTVVLPPKKVSAEQDEDHNEVEDGHRSKRQRRRRSWDDDKEDDDDDEGDRRRKETTHFTVTIDSPSKKVKDFGNKSTDRSRSTKDDDDHSTTVLDARQILERKRRNRK